MLKPMCDHIEVDMQVKRAYRTLATKAHPDKGGDGSTFDKIKKAYSVISDASQVAI